MNSATYSANSIRSARRCSSAGSASPTSTPRRRVGGQSGSVASEKPLAWSAERHRTPATVRAVSGSDVRVLYVLGIYHSGTTVRSNLVGQRDGFFAAGELRHLWPKLALGGYRCGCGEPLEACPVWTEILRSACGEGADHVAWARQMWQWQREVLRKHHTWAAVPGLLRRRAFSRDSPAGRYAGEPPGLAARCCCVTRTSSPGRMSRSRPCRRWPESRPGFRSPPALSLQ